MTVASLAGTLYKAGWYFYALGPQMVVCMWLGYLAARRTSGNVLDWLIAGFAAALVPIAGVLVMLGLWWRAGSAPPALAQKDHEPPS
jgi:hypothetical protein